MLGFEEWKREEDANWLEYLNGMVRGSQADEIVSILKEPQFDEARHDSKLFWGMRVDCLNIYYRGGSIAKIIYDKRRKALRFSFDPYYFPPDKRDSKLRALSANDWLEMYRNGTLKKAVEEWQIGKKKYERIAQQRLINLNNANPKSAYYCFDMEYSFKRADTNAPSFGRFDILAISRKPVDQGKHQLLLIEVKYGTGAYSSSCRQLPDGRRACDRDFTDPKFNAGSGIAGHLCDYARYLTESSDTVRRLRMELGFITNAQSDLGLANVPSIGHDDILDWPEICILTITGTEKIEEAQKKMRRYLFEDEKQKSSRTAQLLLKKNGFSLEERPYGLKLTGSKLAHGTRIKTLFLAQAWDKLLIDDLFDLDQYAVGLCP